ncbi:hypothetical protein EDD17DRAFT_1564850 [Pisolithus thermaeus]|nr:hypothetical protein EV401DRAFT_69477 [Pisolithus croceorrhizus]KAI6164004.1 hypothetical protein EDD17DRAFT_1564850 [Pisolithus thermaeus]
MVPPEIWLKIFHFATDAPGLLDCGPSQSDLPPVLVREQELQLLRESLITKRSLVLVCKTWSELAIEFLYQSILITRVRALIPLHEALQGRARAAGTSSTNPARWTRRLDVVIERNQCETADYGILADVIRYFSNLSIVTLSIPILPFNDYWLRQLPVEIIASLVETCGPSLRIFDCAESLLRPCREDLMLLLAGSPNLRILRCPICSPTPGDRSPCGRSDVPVMANLESISLMSVFLRDYLPRERKKNHLPALRQLTYGCISPPFFAYAWKSFVKSSCAAVTCVTLDFSFQGDSLQKELDLLSECCPVLEKLVIHFRSWMEFIPHLALPPISQLRIYSKLAKAPAFHYSSLLYALTTLTASKLGSVRLIHANAVDEFRDCLRSLPQGELDDLSSKAFRVEDHEGRAMLFGGRCVS